MRPLVSVLMPLYDGARTVRSALRSILRQSYPELEVVVVDDGSTDRGPELVESIARVDGRIRLFQQEHAGISAALNHGLSRCHGEYLARMDADDISCRHRLASQVALLDERPELALVGTCFRLVPRHQLSDGMRRYEAWSNTLCTPEAIRRDLFIESPFCHPSVTMRTLVLRQLGGYRDRGWPEDYDLWLRLDAAGLRLAKVDRPLLLWRESESRLSRIGPAYHRERFLALKLHHLRRRAAGRRVLVWGAGQEGKPWLRALAEAGLLADRVVDVDPRKLGQRIHGCQVIPPAALGGPTAGELLIVAVGAPGARQVIRRHLQVTGYREGDDFLCVA